MSEPVPKLLIGRLPGSHVRIPSDHQTVGRVHAESWRDHDGRVFVRDLASIHGTTVNGIAISRVTLLKPGDLVCFGGVSTISHQELVGAFTRGEE